MSASAAAQTWVSGKLRGAVTVQQRYLEEK
jgi:hypothetical protein